MSPKPQKHKRVPKNGLIVNADDLGLSEKVNVGILRAHNHGIVTAASIMAVGSAYDHAVNLCHSNPSLDVGIHLTLIEEKPLLPTNSISSLVDDKGRFHRNVKEFTKRYYLGKINFDEVRIELEAQIVKVLANNIRISHIDSHQHVHLLPQILSVALELAEQYRIGSIRIPWEKFHWKEVLSLSSVARNFQLCILRVFCYQAAKSIKNMVRTDHFMGFLNGGNLNIENLRKLLLNMPKSGVCELMCHPSLVDSETRYAHWKYNGHSELSALLDEEIKQLIPKKKIKLINFRYLLKKK